MRFTTPRFSGRGPPLTMQLSRLHWLSRIAATLSAGARAAGLERSDFVPCAGFWTPATTRLSACAAGRRPKSVEARSRGEFAGGSAASAMGFDVSAELDGARDTGAMRPAWLHAGAGESARRAPRRALGAYQRATGGSIAVNRVEKNRRQREASAKGWESGGAQSGSGS